MTHGGVVRVLCDVRLEACRASGGLHHTVWPARTVRRVTACVISIACMRVYPVSDLYPSESAKRGSERNTKRHTRYGEGDGCVGEGFGVSVQLLMCSAPLNVHRGSHKHPCRVVRGAASFGRAAERATSEEVGAEEHGSAHVAGHSSRTRSSEPHQEA